MQETRVLLVFPGSLFGGRWADGPRVKPELVQLFSELRRAGYEVDVLDLETELGNPADETARESFLQIADGLLAERQADLVVVSCWSALQYSAALAVAERVRRPAAGRRDRCLRSPRLGAARRFQRRRRTLRLADRREAESAGRDARGPGRRGQRETGACHSLEARRCRWTPRTCPTTPRYPYAAEGLPELGLFLSRGCPYNAPACLLRPGGAGWHAYPPDVAVAAVDAVGGAAPGQGPGARPCVRLRGRVAARRPRPAGGRRPARPRAQRDRPPRGAAAPGRRQALPGARGPRPGGRHALAGPARPDEPGAVPAEGGRARPRTARVPEREGRRSRGRRFEFNQPGETEESAAETLDALERLVADVPNTSLTIEAQAWAYLPTSEEGADVDAPASRFGTRIEHPEWWKERTDAHAAATAVVASHELAGRRPATRTTGGRASRTPRGAGGQTHGATRAAACAATRR